MALLTQREKTIVRLAADGPYADVRLEVSLQPYVIRPDAPESDAREPHNENWADMLPQSGTVAMQSHIEAEIRAVAERAGLALTDIKRVTMTLFVNENRRMAATGTRRTRRHPVPRTAPPL